MVRAEAPSELCQEPGTKALVLGSGDPLGSQGLVKVRELGVESGASALATLLGRSFGRKRGGNGRHEEAKEAHAQHHQERCGETPLGGHGGNVAESHGGGDDRPPERIESRLNRRVLPKLGAIQPHGRNTHDRDPQNGDAREGNRTAAHRRGLERRTDVLRHAQQAHQAQQSHASHRREDAHQINQRTLEVPRAARCNPEAEQVLRHEEAREDPLNVREVLRLPELRRPHAHIHRRCGKQRKQQLPRAEVLLYESIAAAAESHSGDSTSNGWSLS